MVNVSKFQAATDLLKRAESIDPNHYRLHAIRGNLANQQDRPEEAIQEYQTAISRLPDGVPDTCPHIAPQDKSTYATLKVVICVLCRWVRTE